MALAHLMGPVIDASLVAGVAVMLPLAFRRPFTAFQVAGLGVLASLLVAPGWPAAAALAPWLVLSAREVLSAVRRRRLAPLVMGGFSLTAAVALIFSRMEWDFFGTPEPILTLTAVHFTWAGAGTLGLASRLVEQHPNRVRRATGLLLMLAPPYTAVGFLTRLAIFQVGGAVLMSVAVLAIAILMGIEAGRREGPVRWLLLTSAASPWLAMGLAVAWAANQYWADVPALSVPDMVPTHGALNAFGFVLSGHLAWRLEARGH